MTHHKKGTIGFRAIGLYVAVCLAAGSMYFYVQRLGVNDEQAHAVALDLPSAQQLLAPSYTHSYPVLKGIQLDPKDPLKLQFVIDTQDKDEISEEEASDLIKYFLAALTTPEQDLWVNLSPYEQDRIIPDSLGVTDLGKDMLAQDYLLKQLIASFMHPDTATGKDYWEMTYKEIYKLAATINVPVNTFNKVWIVPGQAKVIEDGTIAMITDASLKVLLEEDYLALSRHSEQQEKPLTQAEQINKVTSCIMKETILPELSGEVNHKQHFARLRQIYHSVILAAWFKQKLRNSIYQYYIDKNKVTGIDIEDKDIKNTIYDQYVESFKKGIYNYIRKDYDPYERRQIKRRYFSGGLGFSDSEEWLNVSVSSSPIRMTRRTFFTLGTMFLTACSIAPVKTLTLTVPEPILASEASVMQYIEQNARTNITQTIVDLFEQGAQVVMLGEEHSSVDHKNVMVNVMSIMRDRGLTDIVLEIDEQYQEYIDLYMKSGNPRMLDGIIYSDIPVGFPEAAFAAYEDIFSAARSAGIKVTAFDPRTAHTTVPGMGDEYGYVTNAQGERVTVDEGMALHVFEILKKNPHAKIIGFAGSRHVAAGFSDYKKANIDTAGRVLKTALGDKVKLVIQETYTTEYLVGIDPVAVFDKINAYAEKTSLAVKPFAVNVTPDAPFSQDVLYKTWETNEPSHYLSGVDIYVRYPDEQARIAVEKEALLSEFDDVVRQRIAISIEGEINSREELKKFKEYIITPLSKINLEKQLFVLDHIDAYAWMNSKHVANISYNLIPTLNYIGFSQGKITSVPGGVDIWKTVLGSDVSLATIFRKLISDYYVSEVFHQLSRLSPQRRAILLKVVPLPVACQDDSMKRLFYAFVGTTHKWRGDAKVLEDILRLMAAQVDTYRKYWNMFVLFEVVPVSSVATVETYVNRMREINTMKDYDRKDEMTKLFHGCLSLLVRLARDEVISSVEAENALISLVTGDMVGGYQSWIDTVVVPIIRHKARQNGYYSDREIQAMGVQDLLMLALNESLVPGGNRARSVREAEKIKGILRQQEINQDDLGDFLWGLAYAQYLRLWDDSVLALLPKGFMHRHRWYFYMSNPWGGGSFSTGLLNRDNISLQSPLAMITEVSIQGGAFSLSSEIAHLYEFLILENSQGYKGFVIDNEKDKQVNHEFADRFGFALANRASFIHHFSEVLTYAYHRTELAKEVLKNTNFPTEQTLSWLERVLGYRRLRQLLTSSGESIPGIITFLTPSELYYLGGFIEQEATFDTSVHKRKLLQLDTSSEEFQSARNQVLGTYGTLSLVPTARLTDDILEPYDHYSEHHEIGARVSADVNLQVALLMRKYSIDQSQFSSVYSKAIKYIAENAEQGGGWPEYVRVIKNISLRDVRPRGEIKQSDDYQQPLSITGGSAASSSIKNPYGMNNTTRGLWVDDRIFEGEVSQFLDELNRRSTKESPKKLLIIGVGAGVVVQDIQENFPNIELQFINKEELYLPNYGLMKQRINAVSFEAREMLFDRFMHDFRSRLKLWDVENGLPYEDGEFLGVLVPVAVGVYLKNKHVLISEVKRVLEKDGVAFFSLIEGFSIEGMSKEKFFNRLNVPGKQYFYVPGRMKYLDEQTDRSDLVLKIVNRRPDIQFPQLAFAREPQKRPSRSNLPPKYDSVYHYVEGNQQMSVSSALSATKGGIDLTTSVEISGGFGNVTQILGARMVQEFKDAAGLTFNIISLERCASEE